MSYIVATRTLTLAGDPDREIVVTVFQPQRDRDDYRCEFEIDDKRGYAMGVDEVQALLLALQTIGTNLYTSEHFKAGKLRWLGMRNLGFPVPKVIADLPPDEDD